MIALNRRLMDVEKPSRRDEIHPMQPNKKNHPRDIYSIDRGCR